LFHRGGEGQPDARGRRALCEPRSRRESGEAAEEPWPRPGQGRPEGGMNVLDLAAIGVIVGSVAWGIWRGFTREVMSLAGWVLAFAAANSVAGPLGDMLPASMASP